MVLSVFMEFPCCPPSVLAHRSTAEAVATNDFVEKSFDYAKCSFGAREDMLELTQIFGTEIENVIERVDVLLWPQSHVGTASYCMLIRCRFHPGLCSRGTLAVTFLVMRLQPHYRESARYPLS
jgi:hypothetical protein